MPVPVFVVPAFAPAVNGEDAEGRYLEEAKTVLYVPPVPALLAPLPPTPPPEGNVLDPGPFPTVPPPDPWRSDMFYFFVV